MTEERCFLCGAPAQARADAEGRHVHYLCSGSQCGEYRISLAAMQRMDNPVFKKKAREKAREAREQGAYFEITYAIRGGLRGEIKSKTPE